MADKITRTGILPRLKPFNLTAEQREEIDRLVNKPEYDSAIRKLLDNVRLEYDRMFVINGKEIQIHNEMKSNVIVDGLSIPTMVEEFEDNNIIEVETGTNGFQKAGISNGAKTYFRIKDLGKTKMQCDFEPIGNGNEVGEVTITLNGDAELRTFIKGLQFAADTLNEQSGNRDRSVDVRLTNEDVGCLLMLLSDKLKSYGSKAPLLGLYQNIKNKLEERFEV